MLLCPGFLQINRESTIFLGIRTLTGYGIHYAVFTLGHDVYDFHDLRESTIRQDTLNSKSNYITLWHVPIDIHALTRSDKFLRSSHDVYPRSASFIMFATLNNDTSIVFDRLKLVIPNTQAWRFCSNRGHKSQEILTELHDLERS